MNPVATDSNLARLAEAAFERRGDYESLLFERRWHRSGELFGRSCRIAGGLAELGVAPGERVVVSAANRPEVSVVYQAVWRAGAVVTPATFLLPAEDLRHVIADSEACAVITTSEFVDKVRDAVAGLPGVRLVISTDGAGDGVIALSELEQSGSTPIAARDDDDLAALLYTGGTIGRAKGVMLSHANLHFSGQAVQKASHASGLNRSLMTLPLSHSYGLLVTISALHSPERPVTVLLRWFDPAAFLELVAEHRLQTSAVVPSMIQLLFAQPLERHDLSSLVYLGCGGAPLASQAADEIERRVPSVKVRQGYGLTETAALISTNPAGHEKPGSVGLPIPGAIVRILDDEGYLFIVDRKKDLIIRGGFNVYPRDVEDALFEHPAVTGVGVVGRPDERYGEEVVAFVSLSTPGAVSADELIAWARQRIGGYRCPREVHIVDAVPLTAVGKLDRKALRALLL
jgi:long-chain acyl-CoA synthetase